MSTTHLSEEQREFYAELSEKFNDTVESIEMVCFEAEKFLFKSLEMIPTPGRESIWAILVFGKNGIYIYINPTETTILGFKVGGNKKLPKEQLFSFKNFSSWQATPIKKKTLFGQKPEKYAFMLQISFESLNFGSVSGSILVQTQVNASDTLEKMKSYTM